MTAPPATVPPVAPSPADAPPPARSRRWLPRWLLGPAIVIAAAMVAVGVVARRAPDFYVDRVPPTAVSGPHAEQAARRFVSDLAALHAAVGRAGTWEAALDDRDVNAWLALDLPRNHAALVPWWAAEPRIRLAPGRLDVAIRVGLGGVSTVAWATVDLRLRGPNQVTLEVTAAGLGGLPLPRGPVLGELRRLLAGAGWTTSSVRLDGRSVLVVYISEADASGGPTRVLEKLALGEGTIAFAGRTFDGSRPTAGTTVP